MGWIGNKDLFPNESTVNRTDFLIGSDQSGNTKTFQLDDLQSLLDVSGYTRAQMLTLIANSALKVNVDYKITDAGVSNETIIVKASTTNTLFGTCWNLSDTSIIHQYNITTDTLAPFVAGTEVLDEDDFISNSPTQAPSQQSTKVYVDNSVGRFSDDLEEYSFESTKTLGTPIVPRTGDIVLSDVGALPLRELIIYHQQETAPTIEYGTFSLGKTAVGEYENGELNLIIIAHTAPNTVEVTYRRPSAGYTLPTLTGNAKKLVAVNDGETDLQYIDAYYNADTNELRFGIATRQGATETAVQVTGDTSDNTKNAFSVFNSYGNSLHFSRNDGYQEAQSKQTLTTGVTKLFVFKDTDGNEVGSFGSSTNSALRGLVVPRLSTAYIGNGGLLPGASTSDFQMTTAGSSSVRTLTIGKVTPNTETDAVEEFNIISLISASGTRDFGGFTKPYVHNQTMIAANSAFNWNNGKVITIGYRHSQAPFGAGLLPNAASTATLGHIGFDFDLRNSNRHSTDANDIVAFNVQDITGTLGANAFFSFKSLGGLFAPYIPSYADDAAADADATLLTKSFYKVTGSRAIFQKP